MSALYQIDEEIMECVDEETGEIIDPERLEALQIEREKKLENVALWIKNLRADTLAYKSEKEVFAEKERKAKEKAEKLTEWLTKALEGQKMTTPRVTLSYRKSDAVVITNEALIPEDYFKAKTEISVDKAKIKEMLKLGLVIEGAELETRQNLQIK